MPSLSTKSEGIQDGAISAPKTNLVEQFSDIQLPQNPQALTWEQWEKIETTSLPVDEDDRLELIQDLSCLTWQEFKSEDLINLKTFVSIAQQEFPQFLTREIIEGALNRAEGILELIRLAHPDTHQVLRDPDQFTHHFRLHDGMYYHLFAMKLLGRQSQDPVVVLNWDPHIDDYNHCHQLSKDRFDETRGILTHGVTHCNWGAAAVRDRLADAVVRADVFKGRWSAEIIQKNKDGIILGSEIDIKTASQKEIMEWLKSNFPAHQLQLTIDLDSFSSRGNSMNGEEFQLSTRRISRQVSHFVEILSSFGFKPPAIVTADSRDYLFISSELDWRADEKWISKARGVVKKIGETKFV